MERMGFRVGEGKKKEKNDESKETIIKGQW